MVDLYLYHEYTEDFDNILFAEHSRIFNNDRFDLLKTLNLLNHLVSGDREKVDLIKMYKATAKRLIASIRDYIDKIKNNDIYAFYTDDSEKFNEIKAYFNSIEKDLDDIM